MTFIILICFVLVGCDHDYPKLSHFPEKKDFEVQEKILEKQKKRSVE